MNRSMANAVQSTLPVRAENRAKAHLRKPDMDCFRVKVGKAIERARYMRGWSNDELSGHVDCDPRQVARWQNGDERPHLDRLFAIDDNLFRNALVIALAELGMGVTVNTVISVPQTRDERTA